MEDDGFIEVGGLLTAAVYALMSRGVVVYIGQSTIPLIRIMQHRLRSGERIGKRKMGRGIERFPFDRIMIRTCTLNEINKLEREMIVKYQPKYNIHHRYEKVNFRALIRTLVPVSDPNTHPYIGKINRRI
jgi:hypothetical protein